MQSHANITTALFSRSSLRRATSPEGLRTALFVALLAAAVVTA